ncbi:hypothetical protein CYMTET_40869 [Cymbomonas tetramitiformis]|uniref:Uncharacterized protein n=1 Tax=Cymbomonas tetramitiformis TaxID=36881 RepID=A0AAE0F343_9CHLO|nr:hypothetical protein CYMTET_40869 [Cymbomonas tetramitiformis]
MSETDAKVPVADGEKPQTQRCAGVYSFCCIPVGHIGLKILDKQRKPVMAVMVVLKIVALVLSIVAACGAATDSDTVKAVSWTHGEVKEFGGDIYIALNAYYLTGGNQSRLMKWEDEGCDASEASQDSQDLCKNCKSAATGTVLAAIAGVITKIPGISNCLTRGGVFFKMSDSPKSKFMAVLTGLIQPIVLLTSALSYGQYCYADLPDHINGTDVDYSNGPGYVSVLIAIVLDIFVAIIHIITPCPEGSELYAQQMKSPVDDKGVDL